MLAKNATISAHRAQGIPGAALLAGQFFITFDR